jgi:putative pyruvate formate lyase activating enzyme
MNNNREKIQRLNRIIPFLREQLVRCALCPRECGVDRMAHKVGFCRAGYLPRVYSYYPHHGEEPPISGKRGSGTIFFSRCNMRCVYCQNHKFSQSDKGKEYSFEEIAEIMLKLQAKGCHNINLVSPTHLVPQIAESLLFAFRGGLSIPIVYNTGGYDSLEVIKALDGIIDIYLPDIRYSDDSTAEEYSLAHGYAANNRKIIAEMHGQVGDLKMDSDGIGKSGLIIRHLIMPNKVSSTGSALRFISEEISPRTYVSLMSQYFPTHKAHMYAEINRKISEEEYREAVSLVEKYNIVNGWVQEYDYFGKVSGYAGIYIAER